MAQERELGSNVSPRRPTVGAYSSYLCYSSISYICKLILVIIQGCTSTPQLPFKRPHIPSNRDHKALNRAALGGPRDPQGCRPVDVNVPRMSARW